MYLFLKLHLKCNYVYFSTIHLPEMTEPRGKGDYEINLRSKQGADRAKRGEISPKQNNYVHINHFVIFF